MKVIQLDQLAPGRRFRFGSSGKIGRLIDFGSGSANAAIEGASPTYISSTTQVEIPGWGVQVKWQQDLRGFHREGREYDNARFFIGEGSRVADPFKCTSPSKFNKYIRELLRDRKILAFIESIEATLDDRVVKLCCYCGNKEDCCGYVWERILLERAVARIISNQFPGRILMMEPETTDQDSCPAGCGAAYGECDHECPYCEFSGMNYPKGESSWDCPVCGSHYEHCDP